MDLRRRAESQKEFDKYEEDIRGMNLRNRITPSTKSERDKIEEHAFQNLWTFQNIVSPKERFLIYCFNDEQIKSLKEASIKYRDLGIRRSTA